MADKQMADKQITVAVPEARVPEFYSWFAHFLAAGPAGDEWSQGRGEFVRGPGRRTSRRHRHWGHGGPGHGRAPWSDEDLERATWLYSRLSDPARELFDLLIDSPDRPVGGNDVARRLNLDKGAHGVAGILAWPGRWCARLGREFPIRAEASEDGGTVYRMDASTAELFRRARVA
jgi:uncharacterized protein DUF6416